MIGVLHRFTVAMRLYHNVAMPPPESLSEITAQETKTPTLAVALYIQAMQQAYNEDLAKNQAWYRYNAHPVLPEFYLSNVLEIRYVVNPERLILRVLSDESLTSLDFRIDQRHRQFLQNSEPRDIALMTLIGPLFRYMWDIAPEDAVKLLHRAGLSPVEIADLAMKDESVPTSDGDHPLVKLEQVEAFLAK